MAANGIQNAAAKLALGGKKTMREAFNHQEMLQRARHVDPEVRKFIARHSLRSQFVKKQKNYYSAVRFSFDVKPDAPPQGQPVTYTYTLQKRQIIAFSYGLSDDMSSAGYPQTVRANEADTNLIQKGDTGGAVVEIHGLSLHLDETADAQLAKYVWSSAYADITLNGSDRYVLLGRLGRITSPGGLYGFGDSRVVTPPLGASSASVGVLTNGMPTQNNYYRLAEKIRWNPSSKIDSKFQVRFEVKRDVSFQVTSRLGGVGQADFTPPTTSGAPGTYVDVLVYLHTHELAERSMQP